MLRNKNPIIIANLKDNVSTINEIKNLFKNTEKEYKIFEKIKNKILKKKPVKKNITFYISLPSLFIYETQEFIKKNSNYKNIVVGAQNFNTISKQNLNNNITLSQIKNIGSKFVILNSNFYISQNLNQNIEEDSNNFKGNDKLIKSSHNLILDRLNAVSKKYKDKEILNGNIEKNLNNSQKEIDSAKKNQKELLDLNDKLNSALNSKMQTILVLNEISNNLQFLNNIVKNLIKNIHYNLLNNLIICYKDSINEYNSLGILNIENCQEKAITIRRAISNLFGIDNAKKVKILYSGKVDEINIFELLENGGIDGVLLDEEEIKPKFLAKILSNLS